MLFKLAKHVLDKDEKRTIIQNSTAIGGVLGALHGLKKGGTGKAALLHAGVGALGGGISGALETELRDRMGWDYGPKGAALGGATSASIVGAAGGLLHGVKKSKRGLELAKHTGKGALVGLGASAVDIAADAALETLRKPKKES